MALALCVHLIFYIRDKSYLINNYSQVPMLGFFITQILVYFVLWPLAAILTSLTLPFCLRNKTNIDIGGNLTPNEVIERFVDKSGCNCRALAATLMPEACSIVSDAVNAN